MVIVVDPGAADPVLLGQVERESNDTRAMEALPHSDACRAEFVWVAQQRTGVKHKMTYNEDGMGMHTALQGMPTVTPGWRSHGLGPRARAKGCGLGLRRMAAV